MDERKLNTQKTFKSIKYIYNNSNLKASKVMYFVGEQRVEAYEKVKSFHYVEKNWLKPDMVKQMENDLGI